MPRIYEPDGRLVAAMKSSRGLRTLILVMFSTPAFSLSGIAVASSAQACDGTWQVQRSANIGSQSGTLFSTHGTSGSDVWGAGVLGTFTPLIEHWDGSRWTRTRARVSGIGGSLGGVFALTSSNAWAVGAYVPQGIAARTLTEHWDGRVWSQVTSPNVGSGSNGLVSVSALSASEAWAVGSYDDGHGSDFTLAEYWNGTTWSVVTTPNPSTFQNILYGVTAISSSDVWAVGLYSNGTLIEHWDGSAWTVVPSPNPGEFFNQLMSVSGSSASDVWAAGSYTSSDGTHTLLEHWDGTAWNVVDSPDVTGAAESFHAVSAHSPTVVWAVGQFLDPSLAVARTLTEKWDGSAWSQVSSANIGSGMNILSGVWTASASDAYAVGSLVTSDGKTRPLIERWCTG